jgi:Domain of unknown function (DUF3067)
MPFFAAQRAVPSIAFLSRVPLGEFFVLTGADLRQLIIAKWSYSYDVQLRKQPNKIYLQVMWRYLEQVSFPLSEAEYDEHLDSIANYLNAMGATQQVMDFIENTKEKPRLGKAVCLSIDLGDRASEWIL